MVFCGEMMGSPEVQGGKVFPTTASRPDRCPSTDVGGASQAILNVLFTVS